MITYPILYEQNETDFFTMGLGPLTNSISAKVVEERNGSFYFEGEVIVDKEIYPLIQENRIIKVDAGHTLKDQRFRIKKIVPNSKGKAKIYAEHISYLSAELSIKPEVLVNGNGQGALTIWKMNIVESNPFVVFSDVTTQGTTRWRIDKVENPRQALGGVQGSILDTWGGEYKFDNYNISLLQKRGTTAETVLAYGRNITDLEQERNIAELHTSVYPFAIWRDNDQNEQIITIDGYVVDCANISSYPNRNVLPVDFSSEFQSEEKPTKDKLKKLAESYIKSNEIGVPKPSIKVSFLDLSKTMDYADLAPLEQLNLCDEVLVHYEKLGINTTAKVIRVVWNVLTNTYDEIEIGSKRLTLSTVISDQQMQIKEINNQTNHALLAANGKNMVFYGLFGGDGLGEPTATKLGDMWYKPNGDETEFYIWNGTIWEFVMSTAGITEAQEAADEAKEKAETAAEEAAVAKETANSAVDEASKAHTEAIEAAAEAQAATNRVNSVETIANDAKSTAATAIGNATDAINQAKEALDAYNNLSLGDRNLILGSKVFQDRNANTELLSESFAGAQILKFKHPMTTTTFDPFRVKMAIEARGTEYTASFWAKADNDNEKIESFFFDPNTTLTVETSQGYTGRPTDGGATFTLTATWKRYWIKWTQTETQEKKTIILGRLKTDKTTGGYVYMAAPMLVEGNQPMDWKVAPEDVQVQLTNINNELSSKVSQSTFNQLQGTVTQQGTQITQNKTDILLKANQTDVNTLTGRVSVTESSLSTQAGQITAMSSKVENNISQISTLRQDFSGLSSTVSKVETDLDNLNVGGRNYIPKSQSFEIKPPGGATYDWTGMKIQNDFWKNPDRLKPNNIRVSFYLTALKPLSSAFVSNVYFRAAPWYARGISYPAASTERKKYELVFNIPDSEYRATEFFIRFFDNHDSAYSFKLEEAKLEVGSFFTNWQPAPEDNVNVTEFSNLTQSVSAIQTTVAGKADQSQVTQMANQITSVVADVGSLSNLNLLPNTDYQVDPFISEASGWGSVNLDISYGTHSFYNNGNSRLLRVFNSATKEGLLYTKRNDNINNSGRLAVKRNTKYTFSISGFHNSSLIDLDVWWLGRKKGNSTNYDVATRVATNFALSTDKIVKKIFTFDVGETDEGYIRIDHNGSKVEGELATLYITEIKLEQGSKATVWNNGAASFTQISQLSTQITSVVTSVEGHTSQISQMSNQITSVVGDVTTIKNSAQDIIPYFERGAIDGDTGVEVNSTWVRSPFVRIKPSTTYIFFNGTTGEAVTTTCYWYWYDANYNFISRTVVSNPNTATAPATASFLRVCFNDQSDPETIQRNVIAGTQPIKMTPVNKSQITQLQSAINLRVQSGKVISQINVSPETILISGKKIQITGDTYISNGVISTAHIANAAITDAKIGSLSASKVTTGTLNAANVNIINLNVDKLVGNLSQFVRSYWNSINSSVQITGYGMEFYSGSTLEGRLTSSGMEFWYGTRKIGHMGENSKLGYPNIRGISMDLERTGDYISWAYRQNASDGYFTTLLTLDPRGAFTGSTGVILGANMNLKNHNLYEANLVQTNTLNCWGGGLSITGLGGSLKLSTTNFNGNSYATIGHSGGNAGVLFGSSYLYLVHGGYVWRWEDYKRLNWFRGKSIAIATNFSSDGTASSWYNVSL